MKRVPGKNGVKTLTPILGFFMTLPHPNSNVFNKGTEMNKNLSYFLCSGFLVENGKKTKPLHILI